MTESPLKQFLTDHLVQTRRHWLRSTVAVASGAIFTSSVSADAIRDDPRMEKTLAQIEQWLTPPDDFQDVSRGKPKPHSLTEERRREVGLTRDTWKLNVISDPEHPARIKTPMEGETAFTFDDLMQLADQHAVRFPKVMTCLNIGCPLGNGIWEGVPLREVIWKTQPSENLRRVFYYGFHNDDPKQMFRSSLPVGRILEDYHDLPPVILCYKLNGQWLTPERGAPVRIVVPEAYGFKSIKWLSHVMLSNLPHANDTYADKNNDVDSPLKTFCATLTAPTDVKADEPIPITGWAQSGISGLAKVQVWISSRDAKTNPDDPHFTKAAWQDAELLPISTPPGGDLVDKTLLAETHGFNQDGMPQQWPMKLTRAHWCYLHQGLPAGEYTLRCRTIDGNGHAQPMPRPFRKSGHAKIEQIRFEVKSP